MTASPKILRIRRERGRYEKSLILECHHLTDTALTEIARTLVGSSPLHGNLDVRSPPRRRPNGSLLLSLHRDLDLALFKITPNRWVRRWAVRGPLHCRLSLGRTSRRPRPANRPPMCPNCRLSPPDSSGLGCLLRARPL